LLLVAFLLVIAPNCHLHLCLPQHELPSSLVLASAVQGDAANCNSSQTLSRKEPKWQRSSQTLCLPFDDDDVTMFTQLQYDLFAELAKWLAANYENEIRWPCSNQWSLATPMMV